MEQHPGEAEPALAFADWLEENGKPAHAEVIRLHHHPDFVAPTLKNSPGGYVGNMSWVENSMAGITKRRTPENPEGHSDVWLYFPKSNRRIGHTLFGATIPDELADHLHAALMQEGATDLRWAR